MIGHVALDRGGVMVNPACLALGVIPDGRGKSGIGDVVRGMRQGRNEAARHLVLALSPGLEAL